MKYLKTYEKHNKSDDYIEIIKSWLEEHDLNFVDLKDYKIQTEYYFHKNDFERYTILKISNEKNHLIYEYNWLYRKDNKTIDKNKSVIDHIAGKSIVFWPPEIYEKIIRTLENMTPKELEKQRIKNEAVFRRIKKEKGNDLFQKLWSQKPFSKPINSYETTQRIYFKTSRQSLLSWNI